MLVLRFLSIFSFSYKRHTYIFIQIFLDFNHYAAETVTKSFRISTLGERSFLKILLERRLQSRFKTLHDIDFEIC